MAQARYVSSESELLGTTEYKESCAFRFYERNVSTGFWVSQDGLSIHYQYCCKESKQTLEDSSGSEVDKKDNGTLDDKTQENSPSSQAPESSTRVPLKGYIVLLQGRSEFSSKYFELVYEFVQNGYFVFMIDHRGQGASTRELSNPHIGYVRRFQNYVDDLHSIVSKVFLPLCDSAPMLPKYLICHSMGSAIGASYVVQHPAIFRKIVFNAPMFGIKLPLPELLVLFIAKLTRLFHSGKTYFLGQSDYQNIAFYKNRLTSSKIRYEIFRHMLGEQPQNQLGGISVEWLIQAVQCMRFVRSNAHQIMQDILILQAENEQIVDNNKINETIERFPNAKLVSVPNAQHEILFEQDAIRGFALTQILNFLE